MEQKNTSHGKWAWLKKYRAWEADRKIFLFAENWLDPELRDDKSRFFSELEDELLQTDVTEAAANVRAEVIALVLVGMRCHEPDEFELVVKNIMTSTSQDEYGGVIDEWTRSNLRKGLRRDLGSECQQRYQPENYDEAP